MKRSLRKKLDRAWSEQIRKRDQYCQYHISGSNYSRLNAHHIMPRSKGDLLRWDVVNGISLCVHCHKWHDRSAHKSQKKFQEWFRLCHPEKWRYLMKQKRKLVQFKDYDFEEILYAIESETPLGDVLKKGGVF